MYMYSGPNNAYDMVALILQKIAGSEPSIS